MFARNYSNQNNGGVNVNTTFKTMFSDLSSMTVGAWNGQLSIRMVPCTGVDANGLRQYDQNRRGNTALYPEKAFALKEGIDARILPELEKIKRNEEASLPASAGVVMGSNEKRNMLAVELKRDDEDGKAHLYLTLYQMVREDNSTDPQNIFSYKFGENSFVTDYDHRTGSFSGEKEVQSEFEVFYEILKSVVGILPISAHGTRYVNAVSSKFTNNNYGSGNNYQNGYQNQGYSAPAPQTSYEAPVSTFSGSEMGLPFN